MNLTNLTCLLRVVTIEYFIFRDRQVYLIEYLIVTVHFFHRNLLVYFNKRVYFS